ncbi:MAG: hypothetical protein FJX35_16815 [Alphaproteobacteria bacterium]|nr:hypothetical protein [Alphaproteobacteria bacterium]
MSRLAGITVMPEYIQTEGVEGLLDNIERRTRATAVATSPYVMAPASRGEGSREPPIDAGAGSVRLLDRPLWGRRELFVRTAPSFAPEMGRYAGLRYQPPPPNGLTASEGRLVDDFVASAKRRGLKVYLQIQAAIPPGYRVQFGGPQDDDAPRMPDRRIPPRRVDKNGSLASPHILAYGAALLADLAIAYPQVDGFRVDWPEYPPYTLDDWFLDFSAPAMAVARDLGIDEEPLWYDAQTLKENLHRGAASLIPTVLTHPAMCTLGRLKTHLVSNLLARYRRALDEAGAADKELVPNAFPHPWSLLSGFDCAQAAPHVSSISIKLYTMHWPMMLRFAAEAVKGAEDEAARNLAQLLDLVDGKPPPTLAAWRYPEPDEPHPVGLAAQKRKIAAARQAAGATPINALAHSYGPPQDFRRRLQAAWDASGGRVWINRYGYLSDAKLDVIGDVTSQ